MASDSSLVALAVNLLWEPSAATVVILVLFALFSAGIAGRWQRK
jgi:hypothetical protein